MNGILLLKVVDSTVIENLFNYFKHTHTVEAIVMNYKYLIILLFIFALVLPFSFASENQTLMGDGEVSNNENSYYFDASCENDDGDGSSQNPYKYLTADRIKTNSSIYLKEGEYNLNKPKDITNVTIYGSNNQNTTIRYSGVAFTASNNFKVELSNQHFLTLYPVVKMLK